MDIRNQTGDTTVWSGKYEAFTPWALHWGKYDYNLHQSDQNDKDKITKKSNFKEYSKRLVLYQMSNSKAQTHQTNKNQRPYF